MDTSHTPLRNVKVNNYISLIGKNNNNNNNNNNNYYISLTRMKNVNYYISFTKAKQIRVEHFVSFIQIYKNIVSPYISCYK